MEFNMQNIKHIFATSITVIALLSAPISYAQSASCELTKAFKEHSVDEKEAFYSKCIAQEVVLASQAPAKMPMLKEYRNWSRTTAAPYSAKQGHYKMTYVNDAGYETFIAYDDSLLPEGSIVVTENFQIADNGEITVEAVEVVHRKDDKRNEQTKQSEQQWELFSISNQGELAQMDNHIEMCGKIDSMMDCFEVPKEEMLLH